MKKPIEPARLTVSEAITEMRELAEMLSLHGKATHDEYSTLQEIFADLDEREQLRLKQLQQGTKK